MSLQTFPASHSGLGGVYGPYTQRGKELDSDYVLPKTKYNSINASCNNNKFYLSFSNIINIGDLLGDAAHYTAGVPL